MANDVEQLDGYEHLLGDIVALLDQARTAVARNVNTVMTAEHWCVGHRIIEEEQAGADRAVYGAEAMERLAADLTCRFGRGYGVVNLYLMRQFRLAWPPERILESMIGESGATAPRAGTILESTIQESGPSLALPAAVPPRLDSPVWAALFPLPWTAYVRLLRVKDYHARAFYEAEALRNGWTINQLKRQIAAQFYERTALSRDKAAMLQRGQREASRADPEPPVNAAFRDPYMLEFLNLKDEYSETDLEDALLTHLADFLLELGDDFAFIGRQRRLRLDDTWFRVDLVFYHRRLRCLVLIDLKQGRFSYTDAGQMTLYLNYARTNWIKEGENPPVGLILCAEKGADEAHYALDGLPNPVLAAEYKLFLPDATILANELARTREELERRA